MRRFDPETQRSSSAVDERFLLLPLTETPATEALLGADQRAAHEAHGESEAARVLEIRKAARSR